MIKSLVLLAIGYVSAQDDKTTPDLSDCVIWNDGCNNCRVFDGKLGECSTKYKCKEPVEPYCI